MSLLERLGLRSGDNGTVSSSNGESGIRRERAERAASLRAEGFTIAQIAEDLGISYSYASTLLNDPDGSKEKKRKLSYGGECEDCGKPTSGSNGRAAAPRRCIGCTQRINRYWTPDRIVESIRRFAEENGRRPVSTEWLSGGHGRKGDGYPFTSTVLMVFGSWANAIEAAGFPRPTMGNKPRGSMRRVTTEELIQRIRDASEIVYRAPSSTQLVGTYNLLARRGISWAEACEMAGVTPRRRAAK